ncbi:preprotein translocase subunit SecG [Campylobacterota bacterium]|nr:preprotein translocase subunit SecG [Campylobacterota bacterium]
MTHILLISQFVFAVLMVLIVLMQKSSSIGLGAYSGSNESLFGSRGPSGFLAKTTALLGILLVANSISLTYLYYNERDASVVDSAIVAPVPQAQQVPLQIENGEAASTDAPSAPQD